MTQRISSPESSTMENVYKYRRTTTEVTNSDRKTQCSACIKVSIKMEFLMPLFYIHEEKPYVPCMKRMRQRRYNPYLDVTNKQTKENKKVQSGKSRTGVKMVDKKCQPERHWSRRLHLKGFNNQNDLKVAMIERNKIKLEVSKESKFEEDVELHKVIREVTVPVNVDLGSLNVSMNSKGWVTLKAALVEEVKETENSTGIEDTNTDTDNKKDISKEGLDTPSEAIKENEEDCDDCVLSSVQLPKAKPKISTGERNYQLAEVTPVDKINVTKSISTEKQEKQVQKYGKVNVNFDLKGFPKDAVKVKVVDDRLDIEAVSEEKSDGFVSYRACKRSFILPPNIDPSTIRSTLNSDGKLSISGLRIEKDSDCTPSPPAGGSTTQSSEMESDHKNEADNTEEDVLTLSIPETQQDAGAEDEGKDETLAENTESMEQDEQVENIESNDGELGDNTEEADGKLGDNMDDKSEDLNQEDIDRLLGDTDEEDNKNKSEETKTDAPETPDKSNDELMDTSAEGRLQIVEESEQDHTEETKENEKKKEGEESKKEGDEADKEAKAVDADTKMDKHEEDKENDVTRSMSGDSIDKRLLEDPIDREVEPDFNSSLNTSHKVDDFVILDNGSGGPPKKVKQRLHPKKRGSHKKTKMISEAVLVPFKHGWGRELVWRATNAEGKKTGDVYYFTPVGNKVRSMPMVVEYLTRTMSPLTTKNFTFMKESIYKEPEETVRYANAGKFDRGRKPTLSPVKSSPKTALKKPKNSAKETPGKKTDTTETSKSVSVKRIEVLLEKIKEAKSQKKQFVAKKKTGNVIQLSASTTGVKRPSDSTEKPTQVKKIKIVNSAAAKDSTVTAPEPDNPIGPSRLCGLECPNLKNIPPTLLCDRCVCLFHPECVSYRGTGNSFMCQDCLGTAISTGSSLVSNSPKTTTRKITASLDFPWLPSLHLYAQSKTLTNHNNQKPAPVKKPLKNTYHAANLKLFVPRPSTSPEPTPPNTPTSPEHQPASFAPLSALPDQDTSSSPTHTPGKRKSPIPNSPQPLIKVKTDRQFQPPPTQMRKFFATMLGIKPSKPVFFGRSTPLTTPKRKFVSRSDGNCYFRSISYILSGSENNHQAIRDSVVNHMTNDITAKLEIYTNQRLGAYMEETPMQQTGVWATDAEIMATASLLGIDIVVYSKIGDNMDWLVYPASFDLNRLTDYSLYIENTGDHFNAVISVT